MLKSKLLILILLFTSFAKAQVIPFGLMMTEKGKLEQVEYINYRGYIVDTIYLEYKDKFEFGDSENFTLGFLTFIEPPSESSQFSSNYDPSKQYDTSYEEVITTYPTTSPFYFINPYEMNPFSIDSTITIYTDTLDSTQKNSFQPLYDDWVGLNITDSNLVQIKSILRNYVNQLWGKNDKDDLRWELYQKLSQPDTVIEKITCFDYILDKVLFYNYQDTFLTSILGYHWDSGVEMDSLRYDRKGNVIYYGRETPGIYRHELHFKYDRKRRIISVEKIYLTLFNQEDDFYKESEKIIYLYKYNKQGKISEIKVIQKDQDPDIIRVFWGKPPQKERFKTHVSIFTFD